jgi:hypothetical protein
MYRLRRQLARASNMARLRRAASGQTGSAEVLLPAASGVARVEDTSHIWRSHSLNRLEGCDHDISIS